MKERLKIAYLPVRLVALWERNPKRHDLEGIKESIRRYGFRDAPIFDNTLNGGEGGLAGGNGRTTALAEMEEGGEDPPKGIIVKDQIWTMPVQMGIDAESEAEAIAFALDHNTLTLGDKFSAKESIRLWDEGIFALMRDLGDRNRPVSFSKRDAEKIFAMMEKRIIGEYTKKITAPLYEPQGERPEIKDLFDDSRCLDLLAEIEVAEIPEEIKVFLRLATFRHIRFDYQNIAEYYAHAPKEVQHLIENSGLVIIDFGRAIELGYAKLSQEVIEQYKREYRK